MGIASRLKRAQVKLLEGQTHHFTGTAQRVSAPGFVDFPQGQ